MSDPANPMTNCGGVDGAELCDHYFKRHADPEAEQRAADAGHPVPPGQCWRYPTPVARSPTDGCGEHSVVADRQQTELADRIALRVAQEIGQPVTITAQAIDAEPEKPEPGASDAG